MTWKRDAQQAWTDKQAKITAVELVEEQRRGALLSDLLSSVLGRATTATSGTYVDLGVTFTLRRDSGGRDFVVVVSQPGGNEDEVNDLTDVGRVLADRGP